MKKPPLFPSTAMRLNTLKVSRNLKVDIEVDKPCFFVSRI